MMALEIKTLRKQAVDGEYHSDVRLCLTEAGELCGDDDPAAARLLVGAGSSIPASEAAKYGLITDAAPVEAAEAGDASAALDSEPETTAAPQAGPDKPARRK